MMTKLGVEVTAQDLLIASSIEPATGWGDDASVATLSGNIRELVITRDDQPQVTIRIEKDGTLIITDMANNGYRTHVPQNMRLVPLRPWQTPEERAKELRLLEAMEAWEHLGNSPEEFAVMLLHATRPPLNRTEREETNTAQKRLRSLPHGAQILAEEMMNQ